jgi:hypothetical protein
MNLRGKTWPYFDELHDICKSSAARGKAAHRGTTSQAGTAVPSSSTGLLGPPSSTSSSTDLLVPSLTSSTAFTHDALPDTSTSSFSDRELSIHHCIPLYPCC